MTTLETGTAIVPRRSALLAAISVLLLIPPVLLTESSPDALALRWVAMPNPSPGVLASVGEVEALVQRHSGPLRAEVSYAAHVVLRPWIEGPYTFGFIFRSGLLVTYSVETRTQREAEEAAREQIGADLADLGYSPFNVARVRATVGLAHEKDDAGPASLSWREGGVCVEVIGYGNQSFAEVRFFVSAMRSTA